MSAPTNMSMSNLTMRDYFAAHAPAEPQPWFLPDMPPKPVFPDKYKELNARDRLDWDNGKPEWGEEDRSQELCAFAEQHKQSRQAMEAWEREYVKARCIQWPYAWADEQLKEREK